MPAPQGASFEDYWMERTLRNPKSYMVDGARIFMPGSGLDHDVTRMVLEAVEHLIKYGDLRKPGSVQCQARVLELAITHDRTDGSCRGYRIGIYSTVGRRDTRFSPDTDCWDDVSYFTFAECDGFRPVHSCREDECTCVENGTPEEDDPRYRRRCTHADRTITVTLHNENDEERTPTTFHIRDAAITGEMLDNVYDALRQLVDEGGFEDMSDVWCLPLATEEMVDHDGATEPCSETMLVLRFASYDKDDPCPDSDPVYMEEYFNINECCGYELQYAGGDLVD